MTEDAAKVRKLLRQQAAIATFGSYALRERTESVDGSGACLC